MAIGDLAKGYEAHGHTPALGPPLAFFAAIVATAVTAGTAAGTLPWDAVLPLIATVLFIFAAAVAAFAWRQRKAREQASLTYLDVAGALTLIGIFAAALIEPEQMVRVVAERPNAVTRRRRPQRPINFQN